jgi:hypothetical protein
MIAQSQILCWHSGANHAERISSAVLAIKPKGIFLIGKKLQKRICRSYPTT